jgi:RHS repeat-associated protein
VDGQKIGTYTFTLGQYGETNVPEMTNSTVLLAQFFGHKRVGTYDRLGSAKYNQQNNQAQSFYPYGEDRGTVEPNDALKFATYTRDAATGLDYADQRYYANNFGRMMSPDPYMASGGQRSPASWNRYAYAAGEPVSFNDPTGRMINSVHDGDWWCENFGLFCPDDGGINQPGYDPCAFGLGGDGFAPDPSLAAFCGAAPALASILKLRIPSSLEVVGITVTPCTQYRGGTLGPFGIVITVTYQVLDQFGLPLAAPNLLPMENASNSTLNYGAASIPGNYVRLGPPTNSAGQFSDPVGTCSWTAQTTTVTQSIIMSLSVGPPGTSQFFSGNPIRMNFWTFVASGIGTGSITNGSDINVTNN